MARPADLETVNEPAPEDEMAEMSAHLSAAVTENPDPRNGEPEPDPEPEPDKPKDPPAPKGKKGDEDEDPPEPVVKPGAKPAAKPAEKTTEPKAGEKPTEPKGEEEPLTADQIKALKPGRGASKDDVVGFKRLRDIALKATTTADALKKEVDSLKGNADTAPALAEKAARLEARVAELQKYEYLVNPEASHLIRSKYDPQITQTEEQILHYLKEGGLSEGALKLIKDQGRLKKFGKDAWLGAPEWKTLKPFAQKKAMDAVVKYFDLQDEREAEIEKAATDRGSYEETLKEKAQEQVKKNIAEYEDEVAKMLPELPGWARIVPEDGLKGEELKAAQAHNKYLNEVLEPMFQRAANPQSVREVTRNAGKIVELHQLKIEHEEVKKELETTKAELEEANKKLAARKSMARIPGGPAPTGVKKGGLGSSSAPAGDDEDDMKGNMDRALGRRQD